MNKASRDTFADNFTRFYQENVSGHIYQGTWHFFRCANIPTDEFAWDKANNQLYLTKAVNYRGSLGFIPVRFDPYSPYEHIVVRFIFRAGGGSGADGLCFAVEVPYYFYRLIQQARNGGTFGVGSPIYKSYNIGITIIEFDNYQNPDGDPSSNHIGVSATYNHPDFRKNVWPIVSRHVVSYVNTSITEDNAYHETLIRIHCNRVKVNVGEVVLFSPLANGVRGKSSQKCHYDGLHAGFGGGTGGLNNNHIIKNISVRRITYRPSESGVMSVGGVM